MDELIKVVPRFKLVVDKLQIKCKDRVIGSISNDTYIVAEDFDAYGLLDNVTSLTEEVNKMIADNEDKLPINKDDLMWLLEYVYDSACESCNNNNVKKVKEFSSKFGIDIEAYCEEQYKKFLPN